MHAIDRRRFVAALATLAVPAFAQEGFPARGPIRLIVPQPAGGAADASARLLTAALQPHLKQVFVVDNRPGASFALAMQAVAQAPADGYTLIQINTGMCAAQAALKKFDLLKALVPISVSASAPAVLCVSARSPATTVGELVAQGQANPGKLNYGSVGVGTLEHLWCHNFSKANGLDAVHVPFKGMPEAATALVGDELHFLPVVYPVAAPLVQKGLLRPLAMLDERRHAGMPEVATLKEQGIAAPPLVYWSGLAAPAGTPPAIVELLRRESAAATNEPEYRDKLAAIGAVALSSDSSAAFARQIEGDLAWIGAAVKAAKLQID